MPWPCATNGECAYPFGVNGEHVCRRCGDLRKDEKRGKMCKADGSTNVQVI